MSERKRKRQAKPLTDEDGEVRELTLADFRQMKPVREVMPELIEAVENYRRGRPKAASPKKQITFRLAAEVVEGIKATGRGYNAKVEQALRKTFVVLKTFVTRAPTAGGVVKDAAPLRSARKGAAVKRARPKRAAGKRKA